MGLLKYIKSIPTEGFTGNPMDPQWQECTADCEGAIPVKPLDVRPDDQKLHYYMFGYSWAGRGTSSHGYGNVTIGYPDKAVTAARLKAAKRDALDPNDDVDKNVAILSVSYLGHMTKAEAQG